MVSIVVPAHNEERVIGRCLSSLVGQTGDGDEIVVVCNGCDDRTADIARSFGPRVQVEVLSRPSKVAALNRGDAVASGYPRLYVDADVELSPGTVKAIEEALDRDDVELASPMAHHDTSQSSHAVRAYYRIWSQLPSVRDDTVGRGVYALSAVGRQRFGRFPEVLGDDHFVRDQIPASHRHVVPTGQSTVRAPHTLGDLVRRKIRGYAGNRELDVRTRETRSRSRGRRREWITVVKGDPSLAPLVPLYLGVAIWPRIVLLVRRFRGTATRWERDDSSRGG